MHQKYSKAPFTNYAGAQTLVLRVDLPHLAHHESTFYFYLILKNFTFFAKFYETKKVDLNLRHQMKMTRPRREHLDKLLLLPQRNWTVPYLPGLVHSYKRYVTFGNLDLTGI